MSSEELKVDIAAIIMTRVRMVTMQLPAGLYKASIATLIAAVSSTISTLADTAAAAVSVV